MRRMHSNQSVFGNTSTLASAVQIELENINNHMLLKIGLAGSLFLLAFSFALLPIWIRRNAAASSSSKTHRNTGAIFSCLVCFGGGVFLGTCLLDLMPEALRYIREALGINPEEQKKFFPVGECLIATGFFAVMVIEQLSHWLLAHCRHPENHRLVNTASSDTDTTNGQESPKKTVGTTTDYKPNLEHHHHEHEDEMDELVQELESADSTINAVVLVVALSLHSCFEGLPLGLQNSQARLWQLFFALTVHKILEGFSLGISIANSSLTGNVAAVACLAYSLMTPLGAVMGLTVSSLFNNLLITGILNSLATGTFLFVTTFEILPHEMKRREGSAIMRLVFTLVGFALVAFCVGVI